MIEIRKIVSSQTIQDLKANKNIVTRGVIERF